MKQEIIKTTQELQNAMLEFVEIAKSEENIKVRKIKAHKRLSLARDAIRNLTEL